MKERCVEKEGEGGGGECLQGQLSPVHGRLSPTVSGGSQRLLPARKRRDPFTLTLLLTFLDCIWISKLNILFQVEKTWIINSQNTTHHRTPLSPNNSHCLHSIASISYDTHTTVCTVHLYIIRHTYSVHIGQQLQSSCGDGLGGLQPVPLIKMTHHLYLPQLSVPDAHNTRC